LALHVVQLRVHEHTLMYVRERAIEQHAKPIELDREIVVVSQNDEFTYRYKISLSNSIGFACCSIARSRTYFNASSFLTAYITGDKGAIIKPNVPVIYAVKNEDALKYVRERAIEQHHF
jgi:hypothetical protein